MSNTELLEKLHRTWIEALVCDNWNDYAAIIVNAELDFSWEWESTINDNSITGISVYLPYSLYSIIIKDEPIQETLRESFLNISNGYIPEWTNSSFFIKNFKINYRVKLLELEEDWKKTIRFLITKSKESNQGLVSTKVFTRKHQEILVYNEMKFASKSEIRIAQELENRKVLFFPLPLAVRCETGEFYKDHREVDFLICIEGTFGILEVARHPDRYEQDKEKDVWFKNSGILCIEHYTAEKCFNHPGIVVDEFLKTLIKYKR